MNNGLNIQALLKNKLVIITLISVVILVVVLIVFLTLSRPVKMSATNTRLTLDNTIAIHNESIISYNGSSFIQIDPFTDSQPSTVHTPKQRLPSISQIVYAHDKGMLLNFSEGIINTPVFDYKIAHNLDLTSDNNFTWFLDTKSGKLAFVSTDKIDSDLSFYDAQKHGFYFLADSDTGSYSTLKFYDITAKKMTTINNKLSLQSAKKIQQCDDHLCLIGARIGDSGGKESVFRLDKETGETKDTISSDGPVLATPDVNTYALFSETARAEDVHQIYQKMTLQNISTNESSDFKSNFIADTMSIGKVHDRYYYLDGQDSQYIQLSNKMSESTFTTPKNTDFDEGYINIKKSSNTFSLIGSMGRNVYILAPKNAVKNQFTQAPENTLNDTVRTCTGTVAKSSFSVNNDTKEVTVQIPDDGSFNEHYKSINQCLGKKQAIQLGYGYRFSGVSPTNGRITTD